MEYTHSAKDALSNALIDLCKNKQFQKITVQDLTNLCNVNRQTFYYHFADKYELLSYTYRRQSLQYFANITIENWKEVVEQVLTQMKQEQRFYANTFQENASIFMKDFEDEIVLLFEKMLIRFDLKKELPKGDFQFYASFLSFGCSGFVKKWVSEGWVEEPVDIVEKFSIMASDIEHLASERWNELHEN